MTPSLETAKLFGLTMGMTRREVIAVAGRPTRAIPIPDDGKVSFVYDLGPQAGKRSVFSVPVQGGEFRFDTDGNLEFMRSRESLEVDGHRLSRGDSPERVMRLPGPLWEDFFQEGESLAPGREPLIQSFQDQKVWLLSASGMISRLEVSPEMGESYPGALTEGTQHRRGKGAEQSTVRLSVPIRRRISSLEIDESVCLQ